MTADADRHLLLGLLALQVGLIDQGQLVAAFQAWARDKGRPLAGHLVDRGDLDGEQRAGVEAMVSLHLRKHGGDPGRSLAAVPAARSTREGLADLADPDVGATLGRVGPGRGATGRDGPADADLTADYSVGSATSDGQRFRVLRPHAKGGLGAVFVALDRELHREVALKQILDSHADDPASRARFLLEAEVTGGLEHPGIVPVYGLGAHADGRPFYAMRFIRGDTLKEAIDRFHAEGRGEGDPGRRSLGLRQLLRRFLDACNAVEYAHGRGVLHRDLKPRNIIVGKHGETLVVDWGLAKATGRSDPGSAERTLRPGGPGSSSETLPGSALGTPAYMSPEQARGELDRLGPRSDVYSLGATMYCLLTGRPPFEGDDLGATLREVEEGRFARPRQVDASIDPALEAVCLKAMATAPGGRYASCRALAEDVERWMADEPVSAWREPRSRRLARWLSRHRTGVTAASAAVLAGVVGLSAVLAVQSAANARLSRSLGRETAANAALAAANAEPGGSKAAVQARYELAVEAIRTFHTGVSEDFLLREDKFQDLRDRLLKSASDFYGKLGALLGRETDLASRRALARANFELAKLTERVGRKEAALAAHRAVLAAREALAAEAGADAESRADVGRSLTEVAASLYSTGKAEEALAMFRRSESSLAGSGPEARAALADCRVQMSRLLGYAHRHDEAPAACRLARADLEALAAVPGVSVDARRALVETITMTGWLLWTSGRAAEAVPEFRAAMPIYRGLVDENPGVVEFRRGLASIHFYLGNTLPETGRPAEGEAEFRVALEMQRKLLDENPAIVRLRRGLGLSRNYLGDLLIWMGRPAEAEAEIRAAMALFRKVLDDDPTIPDFRSVLAGSHRSLGRALMLLGRPAEAEAECREAMEILQPLADANPAIALFGHGVAQAHIGLGDLARLGGRPAEARALYERGIARQRSRAVENPATTQNRFVLACLTNRRGLTLAALGDPAGAAADAVRALDLWVGLPYRSGPDCFEIACCYAALAGLGGRAGSGISAAQGEEVAERAMEWLDRAVVKGYRNANELRMEPALDPLRSRDDFRLLMMDVAFPAGPFGAGR